MFGKSAQPDIHCVRNLWWIIRTFTRIYIRDILHVISNFFKQKFIKKIRKIYEICSNY